MEHGVLQPMTLRTILICGCAAETHILETELRHNPYYIQQQRLTHYHMKPTCWKAVSIFTLLLLDSLHVWKFQFKEYNSFIIVTIILTFLSFTCRGKFKKIRETLCIWWLWWQTWWRCRIVCKLIFWLISISTNKCWI